MKRGQSAMEFLMTYGWAIVVILVVLSALYFLGVFSPSTPSTCNIQAPFVCEDILVDEGGVTFLLGNLNVDTITGVNISVNGQMCDSVWINDGARTSLSGIKNQEVSVECKDFALTSDDKVTTEINFTYTSNNLDHTIKGSGSGAVESGNIHIAALIYFPLDDDNVENLGSSGHTASLSGDTHCDVIGRVGNGCEFDGDKDLILMSSTVNLGDTHTISYWVNFDVFGRVIVSSISSSYIYHVGNENMYHRPNGDITFLNFDTDPFTMSTDQWYFITLSREGNDVKYYINGVQRGGTQTFALGDGNDYIFNKFGGYATIMFDGVLDEIRMWDRAFDDTEVLNLYNSYS